MPKHTKKKRRQRGNAPPPVSAQSAVELGQALQDIYAQHRDARQQIRLARAGLRADFRTARADIGQARLQGLAEAEGSAIERGVLGSSGDFENRINVRADASRALTDLRAQRREGMQGLLMQRQLADRMMRTGLNQIEAMRAVEQSARVNERFAQGFLDGPAGQGGGGGGQGPNLGSGQPGQQDQKARVQDLSARIGSLYTTYSRARSAGERQRVARIIRNLEARRNAVRRQMGLRPLPPIHLGSGAGLGPGGGAGQPGSPQQR